jgi:endonuclease YncB( thermonuclease family)
MSLLDYKTWILFCALLVSITASADTLTGRVIGISDGDTLTVLDSSNHQHKIRLAAIDAPEKSQAFGNKSKQALSDLCFNKQASIKVVDTDRYGRTVGEVTCAGTNANDAMVRSGMAWVYRKYAKGYAGLYKLEDEAKAAKRGLWAEANPVPPWEWRKLGIK